MYPPSRSARPSAGEQPSPSGRPVPHVTYAYIHIQTYKHIHTALYIHICHIDVCLGYVFINYLFVSRFPGLKGGCVNM